MSTTGAENSAAGTKKKNKTFLIILIVALIGGGWFGISKYIHSQHHEETDDAQVEANISPVIPRISGYVTEIRVKDNQLVKKGDTLLILDDRDAKIKVEQAEAAMATAESNLAAAQASAGAAHANIATSEASVTTADAQIETAKINLWRATQDFNRYENLIKDHSITQQQYEQALAAKQTAEKQLQVLQQQKSQASTQVSAVGRQSNATASQIGVAAAAIKQRKVDVDDAKLNLSYAVVVAAENGRVSKVNVQAGQFVQAGAALFSVVLSNDVWVVANFKETQYGRIKEGQKVLVEIDAFPGHEFEAVVSSSSPATGARFALLPPDNASGNFVKVVQRLPVKIEFVNKQDSLVQKLKAGMNADVDVHLD
ncbi:membrane fusion protein (multidrug efflux system) [Filimonas zeae]|uniref:Secretion protein HlyD n=1 Tax=Filimonas zeae TaxID=1737353 RepID=A0A917J4W6_9BACT|nr:HlyD family secretion protein [Filimonas zeae]MDR6341031.1 membrane fusion protein (multidrug efflux system) [Filimonas zeae]GGH77502.1 secretion protein HlyD [Filimonas zeae]